MRDIAQTGQFKRDIKRETKGQHRLVLQQELVSLITELAEDRPLAAKLRDHALMGEWSDHRDCHLRPDLVLIYRKVGNEILQLVRLGSHSELGI